MKWIAFESNLRCTNVCLTDSRIPAIASVWWFEKFTAKYGVSLEAKRALFEESIASFSAVLIYPTLLLVLILNLTYATIVPFLSVSALRDVLDGGCPLSSKRIISIFFLEKQVICTIYFAIAYTVYRHNLLFVYAPTFESGGVLFATLYNYVLTGVSFAVITMVGYLIIKTGFTESGPPPRARPFPLLRFLSVGCVSRVVFSFHLA